MVREDGGARGGEGGGKGRWKALEKKRVGGWYLVGTECLLSSCRVDSTVTDMLACFLLFS